MDKSLKLSKDDYGKLVKLELDSDELNYLQKLLSIELVFQTRDVLEHDKNDNSQKTVKLLSLFDTFRMMDDQLLDFMFAISSQSDPSVQTPIKIKHVLVVNKNIGKFYKILCTETTKMTLPAEIASLMAQYNDQLVAKLSVSLDNSIDAKELTNKNTVESLFPDLDGKKVEDVELKESPVAINMYGKRALA